VTRLPRRGGHRLTGRPPEGEAWVWITHNMLASIAYQALGIHARRILDFLMCENMSHAGCENGRLHAPYLQLARFGVTGDDISRGFEELFVAGLVIKTRQGLRIAGGGAPSLYALTWLPTLLGSPDEQPATNDWRRAVRWMNRDGVGSVSEARSWLRDQTAHLRRGGRRKWRSTQQMRTASPPTCEVELTS